MRKLKLEELGRLSVDEYKDSKKISVSIMLDNVRSLHNVGSAFRTSDAFRIEKIYLTGITGKPPHREIHKAALGATDSVDWEYYENPVEIVSKLKSQGVEIIAVEQAEGSISLKDFRRSDDKPLLLIFGNEVDGVSDDVFDMCSHCIEIPQQGTKHSFNISVSIGIVLWELCK
ncbi:MAG: RNA methyltransferase [Cyclobacteriaceae bacterium]|nr:RNA methyltransferase [Cyclobacteriaceae bacterium]